MNRRYREVVSTVNELREWWEPRLDLPGVRITFRFIEQMAGDDDPSIVMETVCEHQYRDAVIRVYLPSAARLSDEEIEEAQVHEYGHVLNAALEAKLPDRHKGEHNEVAAENVCRALLGVARA